MIQYIVVLELSWRESVNALAVYAGQQDMAIMLATGVS